jgi:hypothetical protein
LLDFCVERTTLDALRYFFVAPRNTLQLLLRCGIALHVGDFADFSRPSPPVLLIVRAFPHWFEASSRRSLARKWLGRITERDAARHEWIEP